MKNSVYLALTILFISQNLVSCKLNQQVLDSKKEVTGIGGMEVPTQRKMTASELEIGRRICSNLKKKREFFEKLDDHKEQFRFRAELKNCDGNLYNADLFVATVSNANSTDLEYSVFRENYFKDVVTDQSGVMRLACDAMADSDQVSNIFLTSNFKYLTTFLIKDGLDHFEVFKSKKNAAGTYDLLSSESVSFISSKTQAAEKFLGVEKERIRQTLCQGEQYSSMKQVWLEALTAFEVK